ncbi:MAG TPA: hypothetical protein VGE07_07550, partial [Herpetosiphonaceae bacterium]
RRWGWDYEPNKDDIYGFWFGWEQEENGVWAILRDGRIPTCVVGFAAWEECDPQFAEAGAFAREQAAFDELFSATARRAAACFGPPLRAGRDESPGGCDLPHVIWRTPHGLCILQQSDMDPQFGRLMHFWLEAGAGLEPPPALSDWLEARHRWDDEPA